MPANDLTYEEVARRIDAMPGRPMLPHQRDDIHKIIENEGQAVVAACVGSGKTGTGVGLMAVTRGVWLVIAPLGVLSQWEEALEEWAPDAKVHYVNNKNKTAWIDLKEDKATDELHVHLINWELLRLNDLAKYKNIDGAIGDESHRAAGHGTLTAKKLYHVNTKYRVALSGTIAGNKVHNLYETLKWIWWGNRDRKNTIHAQRFELYMGEPGRDEVRSWVRRHFQLIEKPNFYGRDTGLEIGPEKIVGSVVSEIPCYIQHLEYEACCVHHPEGVNATLPKDDVPENIYVEMTPAQAKVYRQIDEGKPVIWLNTEAGVRTPIMIQNDMVARLRKREVALAVPVATEDGELFMKWDAKSSKADALLELLSRIVEPGDPVLVFTHSRRFANMVVERINKKYGKDIRAEAWTGDQTQAQRQQTKESFGTEGGPNVIVATQAAVGTGTDGLQLIARREVWLSWDENNVNNVQARGRLRRRGQTRRVQSWQIVTRGTIEQQVNASKRRQENVLDQSLRSNGVHQPVIQPTLGGM